MKNGSDKTISVEKRALLISKILREKGFETEIIRYPKEKRSLDILVKDLSLVKVAEDTKDLNHKGFRDLLAISASTKASPLMISEKIEDEHIESGIIFEKNGVRVVNLETFMAYLNGEKISIYEWRGSFYIKIDHKKLREMREKARMSLGDLAERLGVSRKSVYEYERDLMDPDIDHGERLIDLFGEEIVGSIDLLSKTEYEIDRMKLIKRLAKISSAEDKIVNKINREGLSAVRLYRTAPDIVGVFEEESFMIVIDDHRKAVEERIQKINEAMKFSKSFRIRSFIAGKDLNEEIIRDIKESRAEIISLDRLERELKEFIRR
jgi:putative transcriptional regulator